MKNKVILLGLFLLPAVLWAGPDPRGTLELESYSNGDSSGITSKKGRGDFSIPERVAQGDNLFFIKTYGWNGTGFTTSPSASIAISAAENWSSTANGTKFVFQGTPAGSTTLSSLLSLGTGIQDIFTTTGTFGVTDGEQQLYKFDGTTASTSTTQLSATIWAYMHDNSSGTVTTAHTGAVFGRVLGSTQSADFMFGVEGNSQNKSQVTGGVSTVGAGIGVIGHAVWNGVLTATPTVPTIGVEARAEITDPAIATNKTGAFLSDVVAFRGETYDSSTSTWNSRNYLLYGAVGGSDPAKIVTNGPIMSIPPSAQTIISGGFVLSDACGGVKQITSAGAVATDSNNTFSTPSISTTGAANTGCVMTVVNAGANLITLKANATFITQSGEDINLNAAGGSVLVISNGSNWVQVGPVTEPALAGIYLSSVTAGVSLAGTGTFGNVGTITLTPGDWDVSAACDIFNNGATVTVSTMAISINSGNTTTDHVSGDNQFNTPLPTVANDSSFSIPAYRKAVATSTPVYVKIKETFSVATPTASCRISARRIN